MKTIKTGFDGLILIEPDVFGDLRGYFFESWNRDKFRNAGIDVEFVQDNISKSCKGTIRGLHYQIKEVAQAKLCYILEGKVLDVALDIRHGSPTFGKHFAVELSSENKKQLYIPKGFAHGFSVLSEEAVFMYKVASFYAPGMERTIIYNDINLAIDWKISNPVVSDKDMKGIPFTEIEKDFIY